MAIDTALWRIPLTTAALPLGLLLCPAIPGFTHRLIGMYFVPEKDGTFQFFSVPPLPEVLVPLTGVVRLIDKVPVSAMGVIDLPVLETHVGHGLLLVTLVAPCSGWVFGRSTPQT